MFNISESVEIKNLKETGMKKSYVVYCLNDKTKHDNPKYSYFGKHVTKGTVVIYTPNGDFTVKFDEKDGWARSVKVL